MRGAGKTARSALITRRYSSKSRLIPLAGLADGDLLLLDRHARVRRNGERHEGRARDDGALADDRLAAEDRRVGVDRHVVLDRGMALDARQALAAARGQRAERHALVELDMVADLGGLADDDAGAVIDEEVLADLGTRADVDAGAGVRELSHDARDDRHLLLVEHVCDTVHVDGVETGIREDDLLLGAGRGIAVEQRLHVGQKDALDVGELREERSHDLVGALLDLVGRAAGAGIVGGVGERRHNLAAQLALDFDERVADEVRRAGRRRQHLRPEVAREQHAAQCLEDVFDRQTAGELAAGLGEEDLVGFVVLLDGFDDLIEVLSEHGASLGMESTRLSRCAAVVVTESVRSIIGKRSARPRRFGENGRRPDKQTGRRVPPTA